MSAQEVAIFWDYENCPAPAGCSGLQLARRIRNLVQPYGPIKMFKAYLSIAEQPQFSKNTTLRSELQASGVSLTDTPHNSRKDVADKMMIVDMLTHAMDNPAPATFVVISGDRDFAYPISVLRLRRYTVVLVTLSNAHPSLTSQASVCHEWAVDVIASAQTEALSTPFKGTSKDGGVFKFPQLKTAPPAPFLEPSTPSRACKIPLPSTSPRKQLTNTPSFQRIKRPSLASDRESAAGIVPLTFSQHTVTQVTGLDYATTSSRVVDLEPISPPVDIFDSYFTKRSSTLTAVDAHDPFQSASRFYPTPRLSSSRLDGSPERPSSNSWTARAQEARTASSGLPSTPQKQIQMTTPYSSFNSTIKAGALNSLSQPPARRHESHPSDTGSELSSTTSSGYASAAEDPPAPGRPMPIDSPKARRSVRLPSHFYPLVSLLQSYHDKGQDKPFRPGIAMEILSANPRIYDPLPGVSNFTDYARLAADAGIVKMGGDGGEGWISLQPEFLNLEFPVS